MSTFLKTFLQEDASTGPRAFLAAFGKHPGWNDHIDDLGFDTESLALAKQCIYFDGLSGQIDSGAWDKLDPAHRLEGFDHLFLWQRGGNTLLGCIVSSRDGKGRTRYPMILCAQFAGVPLPRVLREMRVQVEAAMNACRATTSAETVRKIVDAARETLRSTFVGSSSAEAAAPVNRMGGSKFSGQAALGPADEGLFRILYQIKNHLTPWSPGHDAPESKGGTGRGVHLRLPQVFGAPEEGLAAWAEFLGSQLDRRAPRLLLWPRAGTWVDVIVGEPAGGDFFGLRANTRAIPCASEVPFAMDEAFRVEAGMLLAEWEQSGRCSRTIFGSTDSPPPVRKLADRAASARQAVGLRLRQRWQAFRSASLPPKRNWLLWVGVVLGAALLAVAALLYPTCQRQVPSSPPPAAVPEAIGSDVTPAWKTLCQAYYNWLGGLQAALNDGARHEKWARDRHLRTAVLARFGRANEPSQLDPRVLSGASGSLQTLGDAPPTSVSVPATAQKVRNAARVVEQLAAAFAAWPVPAQARAEAAKFTNWGWSRATADLRLPEALPLSGELPATVDRLLDAGGQLAAVVAHAEAVQAGVQRLRASGDPALAALAPALLQEPAAARSLDELDAALQGLRAEIEPIVAVLGGDWESGGIDRARFLQERGETWATGMTGAALLKKWAADVANYAPVAEGTAPLPKAEWQQALASAKNSRTQLATVAPAEAEPFAQRQAKLEKDWATLNATRVVRKELSARTTSGAKLVDTMKALAADLAGEVGRRVNPAAWATELRTKRVAESAVVDTEWQRQRDALLQASDLETLRKDLPRFLDMRARGERIEHYLRQLASAASLPETFPAEEVLDDGIARDLRVRVRASREAALAKLIDMTIWKDGLPAETTEEFWQKLPVRGVTDDYVKNYRDLRGFGTDVTRIIVLLDDGCAWQDQPGKFFEPWRDHWAREAGSQTLPRVAEVVGRFANLQRLAASTDRAQLTLAVRSGPLAESVTAWRRLGELPDWLRKPADLLSEQQIAATLKMRGEREIKNAAHRAAFQKDLATHGRSRWKAALGRATADAEIGRLFGAMDSFGVSDSELSGSQKFNLLLHRLRAKPWASLSKEEGRAARDEAVAALRVASATDPAPVASLIGQLEKVAFEEVGVDLGAEGPGKTGWKLEPPARVNVVGYAWNGPGDRTHRLEFVSVPLPSGQSAYLCTTEMPVQLFLDWVEHRKIWKGVIDAQKLMLDDFETIDPRRGPRTYAVRKEGARDRWRFTRESSSWRVGSMEGSARPPTEQTPVNYVSFTTAELFSRELNCRLPTEVEWQAALKLESEGESEPPISNLRDQRWRKQFEFQSGQPVQLQCWPDSDIFLARGLPKDFGREATAKAATEKDDGNLWFADVRSGRPRLVWHLVGNVAEFVTNAQGQVGVIGGSALSPPEMPVDKLYEVDRRDTQTGFADVGFRPAFSAGKQSGAMRVLGILASAHFVTTPK